MLGGREGVGRAAPYLGRSGGGSCYGDRRPAHRTSPPALGKAGVGVLCAGSRFAKNDTPLIMEKVVLDLGAYIRHAKEKWGYEKVVLCGWSGGGSLSLFYQAQAQKPFVTQTPAADPVDLSNLIPADA